jgi:F0F1-type ATP synthase assembly protein I
LHGVGWYDILLEVLTVERWAAAFRFTGIGFYIGVCIAGGVWLGVWLDGKYGKEPLFTLLGLGLGLFTAFYGAYRMLRETLRQDKNNKY